MIKLILCSLILLSSFSYAEENKSDDKKYTFDTSGVFSVRKYDDLFMPKVNFKFIEEKLIEEDLILNNDEILERNIEFNLDIYKSGIRREIGGDVVGNGGGSLEQFGYYFLYALPSLIDSSLAQTLIYFDSDERLLLQGIRYGLSQMDLNGKLIFAKENIYTNFFYNPEHDRAPRVAKTGFSKDYPIYINIDRAYELFTSNPRQWIGVLIHELGHQIGFADHNLLDQLGNKVMAATTFDTDTITVFGPMGREIKLTAQNFSHTRSTFDLYLTVEQRIMAVENWNTRNYFVYTCGSHYFESAEVQNLHWESRGEIVSQGLFEVKATGWVKITCLNNYTKESRVINKDILVTIKSGVGTTMISGDVEVVDE